MSREVKFRGINYVTGEMIYGQLIKTGYAYKTVSHGFSDCHIVQDDVEVDFHSNEHRRSLDVMAHVVNPETVGQYTGLKDKNGVEIYEGDVANCPDGFKYKCVEDNRGCFVFCNPDDEHDFYFLDDMHWEVVGNIHQNPELLN